jgi:hypothetical protein
MSKSVPLIILAQDPPPNPCYDYKVIDIDSLLLQIKNL